MSRSYIVNDPAAEFKSLDVCFGGGGGNSTLGGPVGLTPVFGTGDFSNSSTPPHAQKLERRRGVEPRTPGLRPGRSPLAVAAHGTTGVIRTPNSGIREPHHRQPGQVVRPTGFEPALDRF